MSIMFNTKCWIVEANPVFVTFNYLVIIEPKIILGLRMHLRMHKLVVQVDNKGYTSTQ